MTRFTAGVPVARAPTDSSPVLHLDAEAGSVPVLFRRHPRARRYLLRLRSDGTALVTIPRGGSAAAAREFVRRQAGWIARQLRRLESGPRQPAIWRVGSELLFRGEWVRIESVDASASRVIRFGAESLALPADAADLRPAIERHLWRLACRELPVRLLEYAAVHRLQVARVSVRNQRTRWGSCSRRGTISLNWRLIQTPPFVRDYICLHELTHLRHMNHSPRFWKAVEAVCPYYPVAERWLKAHARLLC